MPSTLTPKQKKYWTRVGIALGAGALILTFGVWKADDMPDTAVWIVCTVGAVLFLGSIGLLIKGTKS